MSARRAEVPQDDTTAAAAIFAKHLPRACRQPTAGEIAPVAYLVNLTREAPQSFTHGDPHRQLAAHVRGLQKLLPGMIRQADALAAQAQAAGRTTDLDHFAWRARLLLEAVQPFAGITSARNPRGWWHGWAHVMRQTVDPILRHCGFEQPGFGQPTSPGIEIIGDLLELAGIEADGTAIVSALKDRTKQGKLS